MSLYKVKMKKYKFYINICEKLETNQRIQTKLSMIYMLNMKMKLKKVKKNNKKIKIYNNKI